MDSIGDIAPCPRQSDWGDGAYVDDAAKKCTVQTGRERQPLRAKVEKLPGGFLGVFPKLARPGGLGKHESLHGVERLAEKFSELVVENYIWQVSCWNEAWVHGSSVWAAFILRQTHMKTAFGELKEVPKIFQLID